MQREGDITQRGADLGESPQGFKQVFAHTTLLKLLVIATTLESSDIALNM